MLICSNYFTGPKANVINEILDNRTWGFCVPNPMEQDSINEVNIMATTVNQIEPVIDMTDIMSFQKIKKVISIVFAFINKIKKRIYLRDTTKLTFIIESNLNNAELASNYLIRISQMKSYPEVYEFFNGAARKEVPIITQLNLFIDPLGMIRVDSKLKRLNAKFQQRCPLLLDRKCKITIAMIRDTHAKLLHAGVYRILNVIRKDFWIPKIYSIVKATISKCVNCKRLYGRSIATNQNAYQSLRINPEAVPFRNLILDYIGPFQVKDNTTNGKKPTKIYILIFSCYWSRAVNLLICDSMDTASFLRALQLHIFEFGIPSKIVSDNGTQIVQGMNLLRPVLESVDIVNFLKERNIATLQFTPYPANTSKLGGAVESLVKQVKNFVHNACRKTILKIRDFQFIIKEICMIINKRPIAYKNNLQNFFKDDEFPICLTPEIIVKGYEIPSLSILPQLYEEEDHNFFTEEDSEKVWEKVFFSYKKVQNIRKKIHTIYAPEFLSNLKHQATNETRRYIKKTHKLLRKGDLVCIKQKLCKPYNYPLGIVINLEYNSLGEVNIVTLRKANKEIIRRHTNDLILIIRNELLENEEDEILNNDSQITENLIETKNRRPAAIQCQDKNKDLYDNDLA